MDEHRLGKGMDSSVMTTQGFVESNPNELKAWVNAHIKATDWVKNNYGEAAKDLAEVMGIDVRMADAAMKRFPKEVWTASLPKKSAEAMARASVEFKLLKTVPDWKVLVNQSFLPENLRDPSY